MSKIINFNEITGKFRTTDKLFQTRFEFVSSLRREGGPCVPTRGNARQYGTLKQKSHFDGQDGTFLRG